MLLESNLLLRHVLPITLIFILISQIIVLIIHYLSTRSSYVLWWISGSALFAIASFLDQTITTNWNRAYIITTGLYLALTFIYLGNAKLTEKTNNAILLILWGLYLGGQMLFASLPYGVYYYSRGHYSLFVGFLLLFIASSFFNYARSIPNRGIADLNATIFGLAGIVFIARAGGYLHYSITQNISNMPWWISQSGFITYLILIYIWSFSSLTISFQHHHLETLNTKNLLQVLFDSNPDGIVLIQQKDEKIIHCNTGFCTLFGVEPTEVIGKTLQETIELWVAQPQVVLETNHITDGLFEYTQMFRRKDGSIFYGTFAIETITYNRQPFKLFIIHDITQRVITEQKLKEREELLQAIFDRAAVGLALSNLENNFIQVNDAYCRLLGFSQDEMIRMNIEDISFPDEYPQNLLLRQQLMQGHLTHGSLEKRLKTKNGGAVHVWLQLSLLRDHNQQPRYFIGQIIDITEKKLLEKTQQFLLKNSFPASIDAYYQNLADFLAQELTLDYVCITKFDQDMSATAVLFDFINQKQESCSPLPSESPCRLILEKSFYICPNNVQQVFPNFPLLQQLQAEGYAGILIEGGPNQPSLILSVMSRKPLVQPQLIENLLKMIAPYAANTLERYYAEVELKETQALLQESHERLQTVLTNAPIVLFVVDHRGTITFAEGKQLLAEFGFTPAGVLNKHVFEIFPQRPQIQQEITRCLNGEAVNLESLFQGHWLDIRLTPLKDDSGTVYAALGTIIDITERKQAEEALQESEAQYRLLAENMNDVLWVFNFETRKLEFVTPSVERLIGYNPQEFLSIPYTDHITRQTYEDLRELSATIKNAIAANQSPALPVIETEHICKDGTQKWVESTIQLITTKRGQPALLGVSRDITERKQLIEKMLLSQKMADLGTLAAGIAHEVNSPLQVITGSSEILINLVNEGKATDEDLLRRLDRIHRNGWRIAEIIRSLLAYARTNIESTHPEDINDIIRDTLLLTEHQIHVWYNIKIHLELKDHLPPIICNRNQIIQVLINLLTNARDAMPKGGELIIRSNYDETRELIVIQVQDSGEGINPALKTRIFDPFFTTKPIGKGTGLGLSIVMGIVKAHGGTIDVESKPNKGTTFTIYLPLQPPPAQIDNTVDYEILEDRWGKMR